MNNKICEKKEVYKMNRVRVYNKFLRAGVTFFLDVSWFHFFFFVAKKGIYAFFLANKPPKKKQKRLTTKKKLNF